MTRIMCVRLINWPLDRLYRRQPSLRHKPVALIHTSGQRQDVVGACDRAARFGVAPGMTLAAARALCGELVHAEAEPESDQRALVALGRWLTRFSPAVAPYPPGAVMMDVTGCERLFGGLLPLLAMVDDALSSRNVRASISIAPTPGAAWAVSLSRGGHGQLVEESRVVEAISKLPPAALRLDALACERLQRLGINSISQLLKIPRNFLPARLGNDVLLRIDQALGRMAEPLASLAHFSPICMRARLDEPIFSLENVHYALKQLLTRAVEELTRRGCGARVVTIHLRPPYGNETIFRRIALTSPTRDLRRLWALVQCAVEHGGGDEGLTRFEVAVPVFEPLAHAQMSIHRDRAAEVSQAVNDLFDRLTARLGDEVITQPKPVESYMPERACQSVAVVDRAAVKATSPPLLPRPARLLCDPEPIRVTVSPSPDGEPVAFIHGESYHKLQHIRGPERLGGEWWRGRFKERDYFDVESHTGERFWVFRVNQTLRWFLHGVFE